MIHGYPTSSFDFAELSKNLSQDFHVCMLDTPGYGFSDKPKDGYDYSIIDDARRVDEYIRKVAAFDDFVLLTHDKGDSVGLALLQIYQGYEIKPYSIEHHFITNGNIYLPLAQLTTGQKVLLNPTSGPLISSILLGVRYRVEWRRVISLLRYVSAKRPPNRTGELPRIRLSSTVY